MMKKFMYFILGFCFLFTSLVQPLSVFAQNQSLSKTGIVVDVIDGEVLKIKLSNDTIVIYQLIGVTSNASKEALQFTYDAVMNKSVLIEEEPPHIKLGPQDPTWRLGYIKRKQDDLFLNAVLLERGLGQINYLHTAGAQHELLNNKELQAKAKHIGMWAKNNEMPFIVKERININTASADDLKKWLIDVDSTMVNKIIEYRKYNPFETVQEVKFVPGFTKKLFDKNRQRISVATNLNMALEIELDSLIGFSSIDAKRVIEYRDPYGFDSIDTLKNVPGVTNTMFQDNKRYIFVSNEEKIHPRIPYRIVNINTASASQLSTLISWSDANKIVEYRKNNTYGYKSLMELLKIPGISLKTVDIHRLADNFHLYTDLNTAEDEELESLFASSSDRYTKVNTIKEYRKLHAFYSVEECRETIGSIFDSIKSYLYVDLFDIPEKININFANREQLYGLKLDYNTITSILNQQKTYTHAKALPFDCSFVNPYISLYTNINTASSKEIKMLHLNISENLVDELMAYRDDQYFGSLEELETFFVERKLYFIFKDIKDFVVVQ